jgi:parallel beta-helix repeat protein
MKTSKARSAIFILALLFTVAAKADVFTVASNMNGGAGSLRTAINSANNSPGRDTIYFNLNPSVAARTITLSSALPNINDSLLIDGSTNAGNTFGNSTAKIILRSNGSNMNGLRIEANSVEIYGLVLTGFSNGLFFGVSTIFESIRIGAPGKGNVICGNSNGGIVGFDGRNFIIQSNFIGVDTSGTLANANVGSGIGFSSTLANSIIGGYNPGEGNVVSANGLSGIYQAGGDSLQVVGNFVGTSWDGMQILGNTGTGIYIGSIGQNRDLLIENNLVCGSDIGGIRIDAYRGIIRNNKVGTDITGNNDFGNDGNYGIMIDGDANWVYGNTIAGNAGDGIAINQFSDSCLVTGNKIGSTADGLSPLGNEGFGLTIQGSNCQIGGLADSLRNIIGSNLTGIDISGLNCKVIGNYIGIGNDGSTPLSNNAFGIFIADSDSFRIEANVISGNLARGIQLNSGSGKILRNIIGTTADSSELGVAQIHGIEVWSAARVQIGGLPEEGNFIAGNINSGVLMSSASSCSIEGNRIGNDLIGNGSNGITLSGGCRSIRIGSMLSKNTIQQNGGRGISVGAAADSISMQYNELRCNGLTTGDGGIALETGANAGISVPTGILSGNLLQGSASAGQRIDVFSADNACISCEGWNHIASTVADAENNWMVELNQVNDRIVVMASDTVAKRSSGFSTCIQVPLMVQNTENKLRLYPNPARDFIVLSGCQPGEVVRVFDFTGRCVYTAEMKMKQVQIDLSRFDSGVYLVKTEQFVESAIVIAD